MLPVPVLNIRGDDDNAFMEQIYYKYRGFMYNETRKFFESRHDIEDVIDGTLESLIKNVDTLKRLGGARQYKYILSATRHNAINLLRREKKYRVDVFEEIDAYFPNGGPEIDDFLMYQAEIEALRRALKRLHVKEEKILRMKYFENKSEEEIGRAFKIKGSTVRSRILKARERLREFLIEEDDTYG